MTGVGNKGTGDTTMFDTETLLENIQIYCGHLPLTDAETSRLGTIFHSCGRTKMSGIPASRLKEFYSM